jgi:methionyl-tRNA formyltransferase
MLVNLLLDMESGVEPSATPQDDSQSLRCYPRLPHDGILDWTQSADSLDRHVRSLGPPYSYAYTYWGAEKIEVLKARPIHHRSEYLAVPGHVIAIQPNSSIEVATGDGTLSLDLIATSDRPTPFPPGELIRSIRSRLGLRIEDLLLRIRTLEAVISELGATAKADSEDLLNQRD